MEEWLLCLVRMRRSPATTQGVQLSWFCSPLWVEFGQEFLWQIKASCLPCLAGDDIFLSFLTVLVFTQFLPSYRHISHREVQFSMPVGACSLLAATYASRAVVPWLERHWPGWRWIPQANGPRLITSLQSKQLPCLTLIEISVVLRKALLWPLVFLPSQSQFFDHSQATQAISSQPLLLTHALFITELYTSTNTALDGETPTSFPFSHPYTSISQPGSMLSEKRPETDSISLIFTTWIPLELVKTCMFPLVFTDLNHHHHQV